ncbi:MAG: metallophosphoesterase [Candidatus Bipolaricaulota bacterium]|nr:metallophosphoesterase [Candidatus Bipolaricaulota bacterium]
MRAVLLSLLWGVWVGASPLLYGPWTGAPEPTSVTVSWAARSASPVRLEYAPLADYRRTGGFPFAALYAPESATEKEIVHFRLTALAPSTWYAYRLVFPEGTATPVGTFRTAAAPGEPVAFGVLADTQWQWTGFNRVELVATAMGLDPWPFHFVLHAGDLVETPVPAHWEFFFRSLAPILRWAPLLPVLGNHERDSLSYYQHFALPPGGGKLGKRWWALHYGDVVVVGLDSNARVPADYHEQLAWARAHLAGPEPHKFVVFHHPIFSSDAAYGPGSEGLQRLWHPVFAELGVDLVFNGHAHNYERIERDGVVYLVVGGGGANLYRLATPRVAGSVVGVEGWHFYVAVRAEAQGIQVRVVGVAEVRGQEVLPQIRILDAFALPWD